MAATTTQNMAHTAHPDSGKDMKSSSDSSAVLSATQKDTAHYIADLLHGKGIGVTRLAHGVPVGGELDHLDDGTLAAALRSRREV